MVASLKSGAPIFVLSSCREKRLGTATFVSSEHSAGKPTVWTDLNNQYISTHRSTALRDDYRSWRVGEQCACCPYGLGCERLPGDGNLGNSTLRHVRIVVVSPHYEGTIVCPLRSTGRSFSDPGDLVGSVILMAIGSCRRWKA